MPHAERPEYQTRECGTCGASKNQRCWDLRRTDPFSRVRKNRPCKSRRTHQQGAKQ